MPRDKKEKDEAEEVSFEYDQKPPAVDLLSYKNMIIEMNKWAHTDNGWGSILALFVFMFSCIFAVVLAVALLNLL